MGVASLLATKASRCVHAAAGRPVVDFSLRRTQGSHAGMVVARSAYIAGFAGTSNVLAGKTWGIPISGTMAHSFVTAFESEIDAFEAYANLFPDSAVFLIDTYDTLQGARAAAMVGNRMKQKGQHLDGCPAGQWRHDRLEPAGSPDSGPGGLAGGEDFCQQWIRRVCPGKIDCRGRAHRCLWRGHPHGNVSADAPYLDMVYKMVRLGDRNVRKVSEGKITLAGEKQVFRRKAADGCFGGDIIGVRAETVNGATALLRPTMENGRPVGPMPTLAEIRARFSKNFEQLDHRYKRFTDAKPYPVRVSERLAEIQEQL
jgi:nicotinate phosphoribosyltransferase